MITKELSQLADQLTDCQAGCRLCRQPSEERDLRLTTFSKRPISTNVNQATSLMQGTEGSFGSGYIVCFSV
jgi:hypothetical protein